MNIELKLPIDMVNTVLIALSQMGGAVQNAIATIQQQAQPQINQPQVVEAEAVGGTD